MAKAAGMKVVSMERTDAEKKAAEERCKAMPCDGPDYPWGMSINLGKDELAKVGMKTLPGVGDEFHVIAVCKVTRVSQSASESGDDSKSVELQIVAMGLTAEKEGEVSAAQKLYGKAEDAEGEA